jgi:hypothetical protein
MMKKFTFMLVLVGLLSLAAAPAVAAAPPERNTGILSNIPVSGTLPATDTLPAGTFVGTLDITNLAVQDGQLVGSGVLEGIATQGTGATAVVTEITQTLTNVPLALLSNGAGAACDILTLDLGPLHLDLLGLVVDLAPVNLDITAVPGPGNLLGNLLCAVAGLLDGPGGGLSNLLNGLLGILNNILG